MKKLLLITLLIFSTLAQAKQIGKTGSTTYIDMDTGFVEYTHGLGFNTLYGCFARKGADGKPVASGALCTNNIPGTSVFTFSTDRILSVFGISPWQGASLLVVIAGKRNGDTDYTLYQPMLDYEFSQGPGSGFTVNNNLNYVNFFFVGQLPR